MTIVRDKTLLPGFYWYDANISNVPFVNGWLRDNSALVKTRKTATFIDDSVFSVLTGGAKGHVWYLFEVIFPTLWLDQTKFGFPNTATKDTGPEVMSSGAEPQKDAIDVIADSAKSALPFLAPVSSGVLVFGGLLGIGYLFRKELFNVGTRIIRKRRASRSR